MSNLLFHSTPHSGFPSVDGLKSRGAESEKQSSEERGREGVTKRLRDEET
jgi:hypothetical protein